MRIEYIIVLAAALVGVPTIRPLGGALERAVGGSGAAVDAPRSHSPAGGTVVSAQAGVGQLASFLKLPLDVQGELREGIAFARHAQTVPGAAFHPFFGTIAPLYVGAEESVALRRSVSRIVQRAPNRSLDENLSALLDELGTGEALRSSLREGGAVRRLIAELPVRSKDGGAGIAEALGSLPDRGAARRGAARLAPDAPSAVWDHFFAWLDAEKALARSAPPRRSFEATWFATRANRAVGAIALRSLRGYLQHTFPLDYGSTGELGVALDQLDVAIRRWRSIPFDEPSAVVRELMEGNFALAERGAAYLRSRFEEHLALWGGSQRETPEVMEMVDRRTKQAVSRIQEARAKQRLSRREVLDVFHDYVSADRAANTGLAEFTSHVFSGPYREPPPVFPWVTASSKYWSYSQVPNWTDLGMFPVEMPIGLKTFDRVPGNTEAFAGHDLGHLKEIARFKLLTRSLVNYLHGRRRAATGASTETLHAIDELLGRVYWEGDQPASVAEGASVPVKARRLWASWLRDYSAEVSGGTTVRAKAQVPDRREHGVGEPWGL